MILLEKYVRELKEMMKHVEIVLEIGGMLGMQLREDLDLYQTKKHLELMKKSLQPKMSIYLKVGLI